MPGIVDSPTMSPAHTGYDEGMLERVRIVLIEPCGPANVGAVCRVMRNMGLHDLWLVAPRCRTDNPETISHATHARDILADARIVDTIPAALTDCVESYVTTAKLGLYRRQSAIPPADAARSAAQSAALGPVAIAFGREDRGVLTDELLHFDRLITVPANPDFPVMNLAAAVTVVCYELWTAALAADGTTPLPTAQYAPRSTSGHKEIMFAKLFAALDRIEFFRGQNPDHLRYVLRHALGRVDLSVIETDVLIGMARQIDWYLRNHPSRAGDRSRAPAFETG